MNMLVLAYRGAWIKERKLHLIWRAIARRQLSQNDAPHCNWCLFHRSGGDQTLSCGGDLAPCDNPKLSL